MTIYRINGKQVSRQQFLKKKHRVGGGGAPMVARAWEKELHCESLAVNPEDVPRQVEFDASRGVKADRFDENGAPVFTSKRAYYAYMKAQGVNFRGTHLPKRKKLGKVILF